MNPLNSLTPEKVFAFFREISAIPHGSGNTARIAQYCLDFAAARGLSAILDNGGNVIIRKDATPGYAHCAPVILQGHMDMVCEKNSDCPKNLETDPLTLRTDGTWLWAEGTTLGGDDGIALAYMLALLDADDIPHPPLECLITRDEETGMLGAEALEAQYLQGRTILNIDSEEEGILTVSCAGGITAHCGIPLAEPSGKPAFAYEITISGLTGGHSGVDIGKGRANAFRTLGALLAGLRVPFRIAAITGGGKQNVIPQNACAIICTETDCLGTLRQAAAYFAEGFRSDHPADPGAQFTASPCQESPACYSAEETAKLLRFLTQAPTGPAMMTRRIPPAVLTSRNLGVLSLGGDCLQAAFLIRSNTAAGKENLSREVEAFAADFGGSVRFDASYPAWEYREESPLRDLMVEVFTDLYGHAPEVATIHAGLECGILMEKLAGADAVSFGPDIEHIHTPAERLNVASVGRTWEFLKELLKRMK